MRQQQQVCSLPALLPQADTLTRHFLSQFMHAFQGQRGQDMQLRILQAIETTAARTGTAPEAVARALVESGLRAPRGGFPGRFVALVEGNAAAPKWNLRAITPQQRELLDFWGASAATCYKRARRCH